MALSKAGQAAEQVDSIGDGGQTRHEATQELVTLGWVAAMKRAEIEEEKIKEVVAQYQSPPVPDDLVTAKEAEARFGVPASTVRTWNKSGRLTTHGRRKGPARGGGFILYDAVEIKVLIDNPIKMGRPRRQAYTVTTSP